MTRPMPHRTSPAKRRIAHDPPPPQIPATVLWVMGVVVAVAVAALSTYEVTGSWISAVLAGLLAVPVAGGGAYYYRRSRKGGSPPLPLVTLFAALGMGVATVAALSCVAGCGAGTQQRVVSATASAARAADSALSVAFEVAAAEVNDGVLADLPDGTEEERWALWCERVAPAWEVMARVECGIVALGQAARAGQAALDASAGGDGQGGLVALLRWAPPVAALLAAVAASWTAAVGECPEEFGAALQLLEALGLAPASPPEMSCHVGPPPGCP